MRRYGLHDDEWDRIKDLLPGRLGHVGVTAADNRLFVEAVLYRYRTGMPWRDLPKRFGDWKAGSGTLEIVGSAMPLAKNGIARGKAVIDADVFAFLPPPTRQPSSKGRHRCLVKRIVLGPWK
jgi:hypothetical protein